MTTPHHTAAMREDEERAEQKIPIGWRVHTPNLLKEVLENPGTGILQKPFSIFARLLHAVAERAIIINDDKLNELMMRLTLYSQGDPSSADYEPDYFHAKADKRSRQAALAGEPSEQDIEQAALRILAVNVFVHFNDLGDPYDEFNPDVIGPNSMGILREQAKAAILSYLKKD